MSKPKKKSAKAKEDNKVKKYVEAMVYLNIRKEPDGIVVGTAKPGKKFEVIEQVSGWTRVPEGYVKSELLVATK